jgi:hypothetical protein
VVVRLGGVVADRLFEILDDLENLLTTADLLEATQPPPMIDEVARLGEENLRSESVVDLYLRSDDIIFVEDG